MKTQVVVVSLLIAGCSDHWTKIGETEQQANIDLFQCKQKNRNVRDGSVDEWPSQAGDNR
jgi:hypothetical protein